MIDGQSADGHWRDFLTLAGESTDWTTAYVGTHLSTAAGCLQQVERAVEALLKDQHQDGGWGYHYDVPTDADSTAYTLLFLKAILGDHDALDNGARCLLAHQDPKGGGVATYREPCRIREFMGLPESYSIRGWCAPHVEVTAAAGHAFAALGLRAPAEAAWRFVESRQRSDGSWRSYWWDLPHYPTWQAAIFARVMSAWKPLAAAASWASVQPDDHSPFASALRILISAAAGVSQNAFRKEIQHLRRSQRTDGSWGTCPILRIPSSEVVECESDTVWRTDALGTGVVVRDQHRLYTTATCLAALSYV